MVRGAGKGAQWLPDRATKRGLPVLIAGLDFEGDRTTFNFLCGGGGENDDPEFRINASMTEGLGR